MTIFLAIVIVGIGTYTMRALFIVALANRRIPEPVLDALGFVAPAILTALVVTTVVGTDGSVGFGVPEWAALVAGGVTAYKTRNMLVTVITGMTVFWLLRALL